MGEGPLRGQDAEQALEEGAGLLIAYGPMDRRELARVERGCDDFDEAGVHPADEPEVRRGGEDSGRALAHIRLVADLRRRREVEAGHVLHTPRCFSGAHVDIGQPLFTKAPPCQGPCQGLSPEAAGSEGFQVWYAHAQEADRGAWVGEVGDQ
ncbi:uncharacterized protein PG986_008734 [Apiospora aurea]|uniref:Uncharacterized protein n=1 Tax=Apiospora aurea TaxID=335848 RepID=A0ABR1Q5W4_9PEZI